MKLNMLCIMMYRLKSCQKCGGDLSLEADEWRCLQCGRYYYLEPVLNAAVASAPQTASLVNDPAVPARQQRQPGGMAANNPNRLVQAKESRDKEWLGRHRTVIHYLDRGYEVGEIAARTGISPRNIRSVRERLTDTVSN